MEGCAIYSQHKFHSEETMIRQEKGFTLVELLISMAVFVISLVLVSNFFTGQLMLFKQQSRAAESNIEGVIGLETLRQDIEHAGYGLPWAYPSGFAGTNYSETAVTPAKNYNDAPPNLPRAILSGDNLTSGTLNKSDYLVIKAINVATSSTAGKWTSLQVAPFSGTPPGNPRVWTYADGTTPTPDNLSSTDKVVVLSMGGSGVQRTLVTNGETFFVTYGANGSGVTNATWAPPDSTTMNLVYGVDPNTDLSVPFNRADYYIARNSSTPQRCASGAGVLYKATLNQAAGDFTQLPLLDCVADMQVVFGVDTDPTPDGQINCYTDDLSSALTTYDAANVRTRVREVRVYILAHEGQLDRTFLFAAPVAPSSITVGEPSGNLAGGSCAGTTPLGRNFDLSTITNWRNYRWKVYTLIATPKNLLGDR